MNLDNTHDKSAAHRLHRLNVEQENLTKLESWSQHIRQAVKGSSPSMSDVLNFVLEQLPSLPSDKDLKAANLKFFDPINAARWGLSELIRNGKDGATNPAKLIRELNNLMSGPQTAKAKTGARNDEETKSK
jgi:hypothetical protein